MTRLPDPIPTPRPSALESETGFVPLKGPRTLRERPAREIPRWLERGELFLRVLLRLYLGIALCYAPWARLFWDQNPIFVHYPLVASIALNGYVRGFVSGLGFLNLWIALQDALNHGEKKYHER